MVRLGKLIFDRYLNKLKTANNLAYQWLVHKNNIGTNFIKHHTI